MVLENYNSIINIILIAFKKNCLVVNVVDINFIWVKYQYKKVEKI